MKKHKVIRFFTIASILLIQTIFLIKLVQDKYTANNHSAALTILLIAISMALGYRYVSLHPKQYAYEKLSVAIWVPIGALACYSLNLHTNLGSVICAGIIGTIASFIPSMNKDVAYLQKIPAAIYCGVFVGMSSTLVLPSTYFVLASGTLAGIFYMLSKKLFFGFGGKLGTIAFCGVLVVALINYLA